MASLKDAIKKGQKKGKIPEGVTHPWMQDLDIYNNSLRNQAGHKAVDPADNQAGHTSSKPNMHLFDNKIIRNKAQLAKKKWRPKSSIQKKLNDIDFVFVYLSEIYGAKKSVICGLFSSLLDDLMTPRLSSSEGARIANQKKSTFERTVNRLSEEGVLLKYGFKTRAGGRIYWFHPSVLKCLNIIKKNDPDYFNY